MKKILCILAAFLVLTGCTGHNASTIKVFFASKKGDAIREEERPVSKDGNLLEEAVKELLKGPKNLGNKRTIPEGTALIGIKMAGTVAEINLSSPFDTGDNYTRLMARYSVIFTACATGAAQKVKLLKDGEPLLNLQTGEPLEALGATDLAVAMPRSGAEVLLTLYFPDKTGQYLMPDARKVTLGDAESPENAVVREILRGPSASHLMPALSEDTKVLSVETKNGICFVNMDKAFIKQNTGSKQKEKIAIYSIVNSLCALQNVKEVRFLIDGKAHKHFGNLYINAGFTENTALYPSI